MVSLIYSNMVNYYLKIITIIIINLILFPITDVHCARSTRQNDSRRCTLPNHPENGQWSTSVPEILSPGRKVSSGTVIKMRCNGQFTLDGSSVIECENGRWKSKIGKCQKICPPVSNTTSTKVTCVNGKAGHNCVRPINGTVATFRCAPYYENPELNRNPFRTCLNGKWNQEIPTCTPICGQKPKSSSRTSVTHYPWNVAIFVNQGNEKIYSCTGSLVNERTVLTAAHCVTDDIGNKHTASRYLVAVGKSSGEYTDSKDENVQYSELEEIFVPKVFKGTTRKYFGDIAVLITKKMFTMSQRVQPVCLDWTNKYSGEFENPSKVWIAAPLARKYIPAAVKNIVEIEVPLVNETQCYSQLTAPIPGDTDFQAHYTPTDTYCAGYINSDKVPKCTIDHGVGLVLKNHYDSKYYLVGVGSAFPSIHGPDCDDKRWSLYTRVAPYMIGFISNSVNQYTTITRPYFQTSCGIKSVKAQTLIVHGKNVTKGDYPWQAAIYSVINSNKKLICGGSLINQRVVLTAAHCVTDISGKILPKELYVVAVGKYFRNFHDDRDTQAQFSSLKSIFIPTQYKGELQNFVGDIAILVTETSFVLTKQIQPVCLDWDDKYENQFLKPSVKGFVSGWGYTQENRNPSEELKDLEVPYVDQDECRKNLPTDYEIYMTFDKMCSGYLNEGKSVCSGDSGGGLVFKNINDERYYLAGIVSLSPQAPTGGCDSQQYALYTRVSLYVKNFILEKVRLYWA